MLLYDRSLPQGILSQILIQFYLHRFLIQYPHLIVFDFQRP